MPSMLVFRCAKIQPEPALPDDVKFRIVSTIPQALRILPAYISLYGLPAGIKMVAKIATPRRTYYAAEQDGRILSDGWILAGWCSTYDIGERDYVIGPIYSVPEARGQGLAHACIVRGINFCLRKKANWVYIDTTQDNIASRRAIEKSGMELIMTVDQKHV